MKPEERANIMKTLKELGEKISQLKDELKTSSAVSTPSKVKTKTEVIASFFWYRLIEHLWCAWHF